MTIKKKMYTSILKPTVYYLKRKSMQLSLAPQHKGIFEMYLNLNLGIDFNCYKIKKIAFVNYLSFSCRTSTQPVSILSKSRQNNAMKNPLDESRTQSNRQPSINKFNSDRTMKTVSRSRTISES